MPPLLVFWTIRRTDRFGAAFALRWLIVPSYCLQCSLSCLRSPVIQPAMSTARLATALCRAAPRSASRISGTRVAAGSVRPLSSSSSGETDPTKSKYVISQTDAPYAKGKHRSNALELIEKQPVIEVEGDMAVCDGGGGVLGHPLEYIKVGSNGGKPVACIYCGLKFQQKGAH